MQRVSRISFLVVGSLLFAWGALCTTSNAASPRVAVKRQPVAAASTLPLHTADGQILFQEDDLSQSSPSAKGAVTPSTNETYFDPFQLATVPSSSSQLSPVVRSANQVAAAVVASPLRPTTPPASSPSNDPESRPIVASSQQLRPAYAPAHRSPYAPGKRPRMN